MTRSEKFFISVEGVDGAGKSSHIPTIAKALSSLGFEVVETREPGGTPLGEQLRELMLNTPMTPKTETMLMFALRAQHVEEVIIPALERGAVVVCDRFSDSSWAYQGGGKNVHPDILTELEKIAHPDIRPGLTLLFDVPPEVSRQRLGKTGKTPDKFESEDDGFFERVRKKYLARAAGNHRIKVIDATRSIEEIADETKRIISEHVQKFQMAKPACRAGHKP